MKNSRTPKKQTFVDEFDFNLAKKALMIFPSLSYFFIQFTLKTNKVRLLPIDRSEKLALLALIDHHLRRHKHRHIPHRHRRSCFHHHLNGPHRSKKPHPMP
jgi:hypothetical protein